jgi:hypothetical protein
MKKLLASLVLTIAFAVSAQAAIGIPQELQPQNAALKNLNTIIEQEVKTAEKSEKGQQGAVSAVNIAIQYLANILLYFAAPLAVLFVARAGTDYAFALGEESGMENAKRQLTWSLLGLALIMFSYILVRFFIQPFPFLQDATDANKAIQESVTVDKKIDDAKKDIEKGKEEMEKLKKENEASRQADADAKKKAEQNAAAKASIEEKVKKENGKKYYEEMQKAADQAKTENAQRESGAYDDGTFGNPLRYITK